MPEPSDRTPAQVHAAEVRRRIAALPRWGYGDRQAAIAACTEAGNIFAEAHAHKAVILALRAAEAQSMDGVLRTAAADAQAERDEALRKLAGLDAAEAQLLAENEELNRQLAERARERDEAAAMGREMLASISELIDARDHFIAERDDYRNRLAALGKSWAELAAERDRLREMITAKPNGLVRIEGDLTPEAAAAVKIRQLPDGCRCLWTLRLPEGEFVRDVPDPGCTADHDEPAPAPVAEPAPARAPRPRGSRAKAGAGQDMPGRSESLTAPPLGTEESGFAE